MLTRRFKELEMDKDDNGKTGETAMLLWSQT